MPEKIDLYDNARNIVQVAEYFDPVPKGLNRRFVHIWFVNADKQFLIQQRMTNTSRFPNKWGATGGCVRHNESRWNTLVRESRAELNISVDPEKSELVSTIKHPNDFVDVWLVRVDVDCLNIKLQPDEVQNVAWRSVDEIMEYYRADKCTPSVAHELKIIQDFFGFADGNY